MLSTAVLTRPWCSRRAHHPGQRVEHERPPVTVALLGGGDGEALQVALPGRRAADREADDRLAPARPRSGGPGPGPVDSGSPGGSRRGRGRRCPTDRRTRPGRSARPRGAGGRRRAIVAHRAAGPLLGEIDAQQGEGVDDGEAGVGEARRGVREERAGADRVHGRAVRADLAGERVGPRADLVDRRDDRLVGEGELDDAAVERPRAHAHPRAELAVVSSNLHRSSTVLAAARSPSSLGRS